MNDLPSRLALAGRRSVVAGAVAALLAGVVAAPAAGARQDATISNDVLRYSQTVATAAQGSAQITLSASTFNEVGDHEVTVTGSGFSDPSVVGKRAPLAGKGAGVYIVFGKFADTWKPSENAPGSARPAAVTRWAVAAEDMATIGGEEDGAVELRPDGTFTTTLTIGKADADEDAEGAAGNYGIYIYPGSGASHAPWELSTPITFTSGDDPGPAPGTAGSLGSLTDLLPF